MGSSSRTRAADGAQATGWSILTRHNAISSDRDTHGKLGIINELTARTKTDAVIHRMFIKGAGIAETTSSGRGSDRHLRFNAPKQEVWKKAEPLLTTPVKNRHTILMKRHEKLPGPKAGLSALAHYTMLAEPGNLTIAVSREGWKLLQKKNTVNKALADEPGAITVEVWGYAPALFAVDDWVDRPSLYLSLRETDDERVQAVLEQMMKEVAW